jgi:PAT family beta-lactamase induction signal transducer AmpG
VSLLGLSFGDPQQGLAWISVCALGVAVFSATMDIAVDAYRITLFAPEEMDSKMPYAAAMSTTGWFAGYGFVGGAAVLALGGESIGLAWTTVYQLVAAFYVVLMVLIALMPRALSSGNQVEATSAAGWLRHTVVDPFTEFFRRCGFSLGFGILLFLVVFRLGEAMLGRMSLVFYVELGFTTDQISFYQKFFGGLVTAGFSLLGAFINTKFGVIRGLFVAGGAMAAANLLFALLAIVGPNPQLFVVALLVDNFFQAFATVASVAFISYFPSRTFTGTQYALMASISNFGRTTLAAGSGAVVDFLGGQWALFFVLTTLMVIPGLLILLWLGRALSRRELGSGSVAGS